MTCYPMHVYKAHCEGKFNQFGLVKLQTPEILEMSKEIKEKLKEADQYGNLSESAHVCT